MARMGHDSERAEYARDIRTPLLLIYSASSGSVVQGRAWQAALSAARVEHRLIIIDEADHVFSSSQAQRRLHQEVTGWFEQAQPLSKENHRH